MTTEIRVNSKGYQVWYSTDGGQTVHFHKTFDSMEDALKETVSLKGHRRLIDALKR